MIHGERIRQVREFHGWTQTELADMLKVTQPFVAQIENGSSKAPDTLLPTLVFRSGFPAAFFESPAVPDFPMGSMLFRAHANITEREQRAIHRHAQMAYELARRLIERQSLREIPVRVPRSAGDPERAATLARSELGLSPDAPVDHVIHTMESAGVIVLALPRQFHRGDAFSAWAALDGGQRRPIVVLSAGLPADRLRMSAAHELAHLVMHQPVTGTLAQMEDEAKRFAPAFLVPADAMRAEIVGVPTLETFLTMKVKWGVSVQALIVRAHQLELITPRRYRTLFQQLSARGWRIHEPLSTKVGYERPRALRQMAELMYGRKLDYAKVAADVRFPEAFVRDLLEAQAGAPRPTAPLKSSTRPAKPVELLRFNPKRSK